jgi:putative transposase
MKKRFSVEQIVAVLKQAELGVPVAELIPKVGISEQTFYRIAALLRRGDDSRVRYWKEGLELAKRLNT